MTTRQHWPSPWIFILAAIGSAAGLGNLWRFPYLAYEHGGGAFLLVIIIANIIIGIPLLLAEIAIGQKMQKGAPDALDQVKKGLRYVGWSMVFISVIVMTYYVAVMGWGVQYIIQSFDLQAWASNTEGYFFESILQISDGVGSIGGISWPVLIGVLISFIAVYFSIWKGVKSVSKVVVWSATLPFVLLAILIVRAVTLPGSADGLAIFFTPEWSALSDPELWIAAFSQVFFSLSVAFGVMMAYGSFNPEKSDLTKSTVLIAAGNFLVSLMSGIVVFGTLGYMAMQQGVPVTDVIAGGPGLAFVVFPQAISLLPALSNLFAVLFFVMFFLLALDSAFSLVEGAAVPFKDRFPNLSSKKIVMRLMIVIFIISLLYTTKAGLYFLDITDHFVVQYAIIISGILLALSATWFNKSFNLRGYINEHAQWKIGAWWDLVVKYLVPLFLLYLLIVNIIEEFKNPYEGYPTWALLIYGLLPIVLAPIVGYLVDKKTRRIETEPSDMNDMSSGIPTDASMNTNTSEQMKLGDDHKLDDSQF